MGLADQDDLFFCFLFLVDENAWYFSSGFNGQLFCDLSVGVEDGYEAWLADVIEFEQRYIELAVVVEDGGGTKSAWKLMENCAIST